MKKIIFLFLILPAICFSQIPTHCGNITSPIAFQSTDVSQCYAQACMNADITTITGTPTSICTGWFPFLSTDFRQLFCAIKADSGAGACATIPCPESPGTAGQVLTLLSPTTSFWETPSSGSGTVTSFSSGNLTGLFTTTVTNPTTTPALSFSLVSASAYTILGNNSSSSANPTYFTPVLASALFQEQGTSTTVLHGSATGNPSWAAVNLSTDITNILPPQNGGTGTNNSLSTGIAQWASGVYTVSNNLPNNPITATTQAPRKNNASLATCAYADNIYSNTVISYQEMGSTIKGMTTGENLNSVNGGVGLVGTQLIFVKVDINTIATLTGVLWELNTVGSYTSSGYNGFGLYSRSGGTLTLLDSTTSSTTMWSAPAQYAWTSTPFVSTYTPSSNTDYYIAVLYNRASVTTNPKIGTCGSASLNDVQGFPFANGTFTSFYIDGPTVLPRTELLSSCTIFSENIFLVIY